jgi:hypothetical protein
MLVAVNAEGRFRTRQDREARRKQIARHIYNALQSEFQKRATLHYVESLVEVQTWRRTAKDLEYAHFTDRQLAQAILATIRVPARIALDDLIRRVAGRRRNGESVDKVWRQWPTPQPDMLVLWQHLWPILERRVLRQRSRPH